MHKYAVISLFPEMFKAITESGVTSRAINNNLASIDFINPSSICHLLWFVSFSLINIEEEKWEKFEEEVVKEPNNERHSGGVG